MIKRGKIIIHLLIILFISCDQKEERVNLSFNLIPDDSKIVLHINDFNYIRNYISSNQLVSSTYFAKDSLSNLIKLPQ